MTADFFVLGTSHSVASALHRERMHIDLDEVYEGLRRMCNGRGLLEEAIPLATCGRLEVYCLSRQSHRAIRVLKDLVTSRTGVPSEDIDAHTYVYHDEDAARHLFRVASGVDSVVYGEAQILGQVREAMLRPETEELAGSFLKRLFQSALAAGKRVRTETEIGRGSASVAGAALGLLEAEAGSIDGKTALVLGAGDTGALVATLLSKQGVGRLLVANRTAAKAEALAARVGGEAFGLDVLPELVAQADILVGAVTGRNDLVTSQMMRLAPAGRRRYLLDLAHPRNFAEELSELDDVWLLDLAQVFEQVADAKASRAAQVPRAEAIVGAEVEHFYQWVRTRRSAPVLRAVREQILALAEEEADRRAKGRSAAEREEFSRFARVLARALLHAPTVAIREADPATLEGQRLLRAVPALFGLDESRELSSAREG